MRVGLSSLEARTGGRANTDRRSHRPVLFYLIILVIKSFKHHSKQQLVMDNTQQDPGAGD